MSESSAHEPEFEEVRSTLKVWVCPEGNAAETSPDSLVSRPMAPGLQAILVVDRPDSIAFVKPELAASWGKPVEELFALGLANVRKQDKPQAGLVNNSRIHALTGESFFVTTWSLMLDEVFDPIPEHGGLVAIPQSHVVFFMPIVDVSVAPQIGPMLALTDGLFKKGPDAVSPNLYWWRGGNLTHLPGGVTERGVEFTPTDDFLDVLNGLAEAVE
jgi:hypothetical protein